jgi:hypothetical protein
MHILKIGDHIHQLSLLLNDWLWTRQLFFDSYYRGPPWPSTDSTQSLRTFRIESVIGSVVQYTTQLSFTTNHLPYELLL